ATARTHRFERAMCDARFWWTIEGFKKSFGARRLLQQIARRLVFAVRDDDRLHATFRVAEDGTFADADDSAVTIAPASHVVVAHPALVDSATREKWTRVLDDYEIIQPFPQLQRDSPALTEEELEAREIERFSGQIARGGRFFTLKKNGWSAAWTALTK